jgi:DNA-binding NarL/FixJ family response regulator
MGGKRTTKEELAQLEALTKEGLTCKEIGQKLGRSPSAIRNLRYKKHLITRTKDEIKILFQQRDELSNTVKNLQGQKSMLLHEVDDLVKEKEKLLQNGLTDDDFKILEYLCHEYGDVTQVQAIQRALREGQWKAISDSLARTMENLKKATFGINAPTTKDETKNSATPWSVLK